MTPEMSGNSNKKELSPSILAGALGVCGFSKGSVGSERIEEDSRFAMAMKTYMEAIIT